MRLETGIITKFEDHRRGVKVGNHLTAVERQNTMSVEEYGREDENRRDQSRDETHYNLPLGVVLPPSVNYTMLEGNLLRILSKMPTDQVNVVLQQFHTQISKRGVYVRNERAYMIGIINSGPKYGLPQGVVAPPSISEPLLQGELMDTLSQMSVNHINIAFTEYDDQIRKKGDTIRNKPAYLMGIIKAGPHFALPRGVVLPSSVKMSLIQGDVMHAINGMPAHQINVCFREYDEQVKKRPDSIRNHTAYLLGIIRKKKQIFSSPGYDDSAMMEEEKMQVPHTPPPPVQMAKAQVPHHNYNFVIGSSSPEPKDDASDVVPNTTSVPDGPKLMGGSFTRVTNELVNERHRTGLEAMAKADKVLSQALERKEVKNELANQLKFERDVREKDKQEYRSAIKAERNQWEEARQEIERLQSELSREREQREELEKQVLMLETALKAERELRASEKKMVEHRVRAELQGSFDRNMQATREALEFEVKQREKAERLFDSAEKRVNILNAKLAKDSAKTSSPGSEKPAPVFAKQEDGSVHVIANGADSETKERLESELSFVSSAYAEEEISVQPSEVIRYLRLEASKRAEAATVNLRLSLPSGYPSVGVIEVDASLADNNRCSAELRKCVIEALPSLIETCRDDAQAGTGHENLLSILTTADYWVQIDWDGYQERLLSVDGGQGRGEIQTDIKVQVCRLLVHTQQIADVEKVHLVKNIALKFSVGGYVMTGEPGLILVEGHEGDCDSFLRCLNDEAMQRNTVSGTPDPSGYSEVGKVFGEITGATSGRSLPPKVMPLDVKSGMEKLEELCKGLGLMELLDQARNR